MHAVCRFFDAMLVRACWMLIGACISIVWPHCLLPHAVVKAILASKFAVMTGGYGAVDTISDHIFRAFFFTRRLVSMLTLNWDVDPCLQSDGGPDPCMFSLSLASLTNYH